MFPLAARTSLATLTTGGAQVARAVLTWPVASQHGARRNALVASTSLARSRREREEVEEYLARLYAARGVGPTTIEVAVRGAVRGAERRPA